MQALLQKVWWAGLLAVLAVGGVRGDIVYTTAGTAGAASGVSNSQTSTTGQLTQFISEGNNSDGYGFDFGVLGGAGSGQSVTLSSTAIPTISFTTGASGLLRLRGIHVTLFGDNMPTNQGGRATGGTITGGVATWRLYQAGNTSALGTFTQTLGATWNMSLTDNRTSVNQVYLSSDFDNSAFADLVGSTNYFLRLETLTGLTNQNDQTGNGMHISYNNTTPAAGQAWVANGTGTSSLAWSSTSVTTLGTGKNFAFDLNAAAVTPLPEPGTLALGAIAALGGAGGWWSRRRKAKAKALDQTAEEPAATV